MAAEDAVHTQGTELFFSTDGLTAIKVSCPTSITGLGGPRDQIDVTCLDSVEAETVGGFRRPSALSVPFVFYPSDASHQTILNDLDVSGDVIDWIICLGDGTADPTITGGTWTAPAARTSVSFKGYVADVNIDIATNEVVRGTISLQRSGGKTWTFAA